MQRDVDGGAANIGVTAAAMENCGGGTATVAMPYRINGALCVRLMGTEAVKQAWQHILVAVAGDVRECRKYASRDDADA